MTAKNRERRIAPPPTTAIRGFSSSVARLFSETERLHRDFSNKWVAIYQGNIEASADSFDGLALELDSRQIPSADTLVRFIGQQEMTLIL
jgi:hypothetical protein